MKALAVADDNFSAVVRAAIDSGMMAQTEGEVTHGTIGDLYWRRFKAPKGTVISTRVHKKDHLSLMLKGKIIVVDDKGERCEMVAPLLFETKSGTKRAIYVVEDFDFVTVHHHPNANLETVKEDLTCESVKEYRRLTYGVEH